MRLIEHIIEPEHLVMTWQDNHERTRYVIAELIREQHSIHLKYLIDTNDFHRAQVLGFESYPAFQNIHETYEQGVMAALMRRLPPKSRMDYPQYLTGLRISPHQTLSDFALLGYSGAKLPSDGFAIIHPFGNITGPFEFLLESAGFRFLQKEIPAVGEPVSFQLEYDETRTEQVIKILLGDTLIGYVTRALIHSFSQWLLENRIAGAWVEKVINTPFETAIYLFVKVQPKDI